MLTGSPVEATSSAMLLLISQSEHDSFSMLMETNGLFNSQRNNSKHQMAACGTSVVTCANTPLDNYTFSVCLYCLSCLVHLMSWSTLHNGDMSSNVLENFTTYKGTCNMGSDRHSQFLSDCVCAIIDSSVDTGNVCSTWSPRLFSPWG